MRSLTKLTGLLVLSGCSSLQSLPWRAAAAPSVDGIRGSIELRQEFEAKLVSVRHDSVATIGDSAGPTGTLRLTLVPDEKFEYQLTILDAADVRFTTGHICRRGAGGEEVVVASLFADVLLTGRYVQLRGNGSAAREITTTELAEMVRQRPEVFEVHIEAVAGTGLSLRGQVH